MIPGLPPCPGPPDWLVHFEALERDLDALRSLRGCPQDPEHHAEGDVHTHTRMVCEALLLMPAFRRMPLHDRAILFCAALLHDIAKPACTCLVDGRLRAPGHGPRGALMSRALLWHRAAPFAVREQIAALVRCHQVPFYLIDEPDSRRTAISVSQTARCDLLALLAEADARGRICADPQRLLDQVALFTEFCADLGCLHAPFPFPSDHSRFLFFRTPDRDPTYEAHDDTRCEVILMSGLPGAGKSRYVARHLAGWPEISLDALRAELGVDPEDGQGPVVEAARARAREALRRGQPFVWNATSISRQLRRQCIDLFASYKARIRIVYVEARAKDLFAQNAGRPESAVVPAAVLERLLARWEVPDRSEAHRLDLVLPEEEPATQTL
jgi:predicted kinase